jgi:hypothetical protein
MHNDLERSLRALADHIELPPERDLSGPVLAALESGPAPRPRWWARPAVALAALVVVATTATLILSAPAREAVADLLGIGGVRIEFGERGGTQEPLGPGDELDLGEPTSLDAARRELAIRVPDLLGDPDAVYIDRDVVTRVTLAYEPGAGIPESEDTGVGVLVTEFRSSIDEGYLKKLTAEDVEVRFVTVDGRSAYWIEGRHELLLVDPSGAVVPDGGRLAGNTLIWEIDGVTLRLEADIDLETALEIAGSVD